MSERMIEANGVALCTEPFGDPADPAILLVMGVGGSMLWWDERFCRMLADGGRLVVRYDHRDTGRSITSEPGHPTYNGADLVADAAGVLDAYGLPAAHIVGVSAGSGTMSGSLQFTVNSLASAGSVRSANVVSSLTTNVAADQPIMVAAKGGAIGFASFASDNALALGKHDVKITQSSAAAIKLGTAPLDVPTYHHQAVRPQSLAGTAYRPSAWHADGTLEAMEDPSAPFRLAVQWHPEAGDDGRLFEALVAAAAEPRTMVP